MKLAIFLLILPFKPNAEYMLRSVLVDDEIAALRSLEILLKQHCPDIEVVATARSGHEAIGVVAEHNPDLVFLDVEMPKGNGFYFLEQLPNHNFEVIFITAYNKYAVNAFKHSAIDYILKPVDADELVAAVGKVVELREQKANTRTRYVALFDNLKEIVLRKIVVRSQDGFECIDVLSITTIELLGERIRFNLLHSKEALVHTSSIDIDSILDATNFCEIYPNLWVNLLNVNRVDRMGNGTLIMMDESTCPLPESTKDRVIDRLTSYNQTR